MFIAVLFTIAKSWKQPKCPSVDEWIKNLWYVYTVEYYAVEKRRNSYLLQLHDWNWRLMLSEISQSVKDKYHMISLIRGI